MVHARNKGKRGEYFIRDKINALWELPEGKGCKRTFGSGAFEGHKGDIEKLPGILKEYMVEVKNELKPRLMAYVGQCLEESKGSRKWLGFYKVPNKVAVYHGKEYLVSSGSVAFLDCDELLAILKELDDFRSKVV